MRFNLFLESDSEEARVARALLEENSHQWDREGGIPVHFREYPAEYKGINSGPSDPKSGSVEIESESNEINVLSSENPLQDHCPSGSRVTLTREDGVFTILYSGRSAFCRGISLLVRHAGRQEDFSITEQAGFGTLGTMLDCSRNAVMKPEELKRMIRITAMLGFNAIMLYTEDTYEIPGSPYFGRERGKYTIEELRDLDRYASMFGIELIPCIQMLAHLNAIFEWPPYRDLRDWDDILNLAEEGSYELIRKMAETVSGIFRSRRINIGMDEAYMLGRGRYLEKKGYEKSAAIMQRHLGRVMKILREYGFQPRMWSDMFFRMCTPDESYYHPDFRVNDAAKSAIPEEMTLIYWDYYGTDSERYNRMMKNHFELTERVAFAGGTSSWYGLVPLNRFSLNSARAALESVRKNRIREVYVTLWGDDGGTCSFFGTLPTLTCYGEACWNGHTEDADLREAMKAASGADFDAFLRFEELEHFRCRKDFSYAPKNPSRYLLWQDVLQGKFDCHVPEDAEQLYTEAIFRMMEDRQYCHPKYGYLFDTFSALCDVLREKAGLGILLRRVYLAGNRAALREIADSVIPELEKRVEAFRKVFRTQWMKENKPFGFDVQDIRFGALLMRLRAVSETIQEYLDGKTDSIPELLEERLPYRLPRKKEGTERKEDSDTKEKEPADCTISSPSWRQIVTSSVLSHG